MPVTPPLGEELYREEIQITPMKFLVGFELLLGIFFLGMALVQLVSGPVVSNAPPTFFWLLMAAVFLGTSWLIASFITYRLTIEPAAINLAFGRFKTVVRYEDIEGFERDTRSGLAYGGWGYRIALTKDGWAKAYTLIGKNKIDLKLKSGRYRHIIFSTDHPDTVMEILGERLKNAPGYVRKSF
jgi:hypothetical protein